MDGFLVTARLSPLHAGRHGRVARRGHCHAASIGSQLDSRLSAIRPPRTIQQKQSVPGSTQEETEHATAIETIRVGYYVGVVRGPAFWAGSCLGRLDSHWPAQFFEQPACPQCARHIIEDLGLDLLPP